jgi:hypothetical protein
MRSRVIRFFIVLILMLVVSYSAFGQRGRGRGGRTDAPIATGPFDPHDLTGVWGGSGEYLGTPPPPLTAWGKALFDSYKPSYGPRAIPPALGNDPTGKCDPLGFPRIFFAGVREFFQVPGRMLQVYEHNRVYREIWTDGSPLPEDPDPRWLGWSVGKWEGDTFVVNSIGFDDRTWLDHFGNPHSDEMKLEERYRRVAKGALEVTMTIDDPKTYTKPWVSSKMILRLQPPDFKIREEFCVPSEEDAFNKGVRDPAGTNAPVVPVPPKK